MVPLQLWEEEEHCAAAAATSITTLLSNLQAVVEHRTVEDSVVDEREVGHNRHTFVIIERDCDAIFAELGDIDDEPVAKMPRGIGEGVGDLPLLR